jgi:hypothetical protein
MSGNILCITGAPRCANLLWTDLGLARDVMAATFPEEMAAIEEALDEELV